MGDPAFKELWIHCMGGGGGQGAGLERHTNITKQLHSAVLRKQCRTTEEGSSNSCGEIKDGSLEEVAFEMGFEGWQHMALTKLKVGHCTRPRGQGHHPGEDSMSGKVSHT